MQIRQACLELTVCVWGGEGESVQFVSASCGRKRGKETMDYKVFTFPFIPKSGISSFELAPLCRFTTANTPAAPDTELPRGTQKELWPGKGTNDELNSPKFVNALTFPAIYTSSIFCGSAGNFVSCSSTYSFLRAPRRHWWLIVPNHASELQEQNFRKEQNKKHISFLTAVSQIPETQQILPRPSGNLSTSF